MEKESGLGFLEVRVLCNNTYVMEEETSYLLHILLSVLSKGIDRHCIFSLKPTATLNQSLRLENAQSCCKEEGLSQTHN